MNGFMSILKRDLHLAWHLSIDNMMAVMFFVLVVFMFPFGVGPAPNILARISSGVIWVAALLASTLSLERIFQADFEDGSLEMLYLSSISLEIIVLAKATALWLTTGLPLIIAAPMLAVLLNMDKESFPILIFALVVGTPSLSLIGTVGAALVLGSRRSGVLLALIILPLYIPILIFGVSAVNAIINGFDAKAQLMILGAFLMLALPLCPWAGAAGIKQAIE